MSTKTIFRNSAILVILIILSIFFIDQPLSVWIEKNIQDLEPILLKMTVVGEVITGYPISKYLPALVATSIGIGIQMSRKNLLTARYFYFVGLVFFFSRLISGVLKNVFLRIRPEAFLGNNGNSNTFFIEGGNSFPSGHAAHFWGLFLPLAIIFPRYRYLLLVPPMLISIARVGVNDHFLSDVLASTFISIGICFIIKRLLIDKYNVQPIQI